MSRLLVCADESSWHYRDLARANRGRFQLLAGDLSDLFGAVHSHDACTSSGPFTIGIQPGQPLSIDAALIRGLPVGSLQQVVLRMDLLSTWERAGVAVINAAKTMECAVDKYLSLVRLSAAKLPVPLTIACQNLKQATQAWEQFTGDVVLKPLFGSEGRGLMRFQSLAEAKPRLLELEQQQQVIYLQQYIDHPGWDLRLLVIGNQVFGMRRAGQDNWRNNASLGAEIDYYRPTDAETAMAFEATEAIGAVIAGVDLIYSRCGQPFVLEVNGAPGWRYLSRTTQLDIADLVLAEVQSQIQIRSALV